MMLKTWPGKKGEPDGANFLSESLTRDPQARPMIFVVISLF